MRFVRERAVVWANRFRPALLDDRNPAFIVSIDKGFAYAMIGKTGNESVKAALAASLAIRPRVAGWGYPWVPRVVANPTARVVRRALGKPPPGFDVHARNYGWKLMTVPQAAESSLFRFAFVRNPWDRLVSVWANKVHALAGKQEHTNRFPPEVRPDWSFDRFARWVVEQEVPEAHCRPQSRHVVYEGRLIVDFLGRFERLTEDWEVVRARFGLAPLPSRNRSDHRPFRELYTPDLVKVVGDYYAEDVERFRYTF
jgi:hypothetical protein